MPEKEATRVWEEALKKLRAEVGEQSFSAWFATTKSLSLSRGKLKIGVPSAFAQEWLSEHYTPLIARILRGIAKKNVSLEFVVRPELTRPAAPSATANQPRARGPGFSLNPRYTLADFVVGPSNRFAHAACVAVAESPARAYNPLFIYGGVGLGKTHLMQAIARHLLESKPETAVLYLPSEDFTNELIGSIQNRATLRFREKYRSLDVLLVDDVHFIAGKESTQEEFFHTFNALYDALKQVILSSDRPPKEIPNLEERLVSRFEWGLVTDIQPPDYETRVAILRKKAEKEVVKLPDAVAFFLADQITANIRELEGALIRVNAYAALANEPLTIDLVKEVLKDSLPSLKQKLVSIESIQKFVAEHYGLGLLDMKSRKKTKTVALPRQLAMYLARQLTQHSLLEIGEAFGGKDHSTVLHACDKIKKEAAANPNTKQLIVGFINQLRS